ncbi:MAG: TIM barrel protein [Kiritimatiellae bacterium]|nr:TIM barrel protein [Kiritimatiellia bacterium]
MYVAVRDDVLRLAGYTSIAEGLNDLKLDSVEVEYFRDSTVWDTAGWNKVSFAQNEADRVIGSLYVKKKIKICAFLLHNNFNCANPQKEVEWMIGVIKTADALGIPAVRIDAITKGEKEEPFEVRVERFVDCMRKGIMATQNSKVGLGIENHGVQGNDPNFLRQVITQVGRERLGVTMDTGNFYWSGIPLNHVYEVLRSVALFTKHTHVKNICYPESMRMKQRTAGFEYAKYVAPIYEGDVDHREVVALLNQAGYKGALTIEDESLGKFEAVQKREILRKDAAYLKSLLT